MDERDEIPRLDAAMCAPLHQRGTRTERYAEGLGQGILESASHWLAPEHNDFGARPKRAPGVRFAWGACTS